mgnify:CR=1 FL=1
MGRDWKDGLFLRRDGFGQHLGEGDFGAAAAFDLLAKDRSVVRRLHENTAYFRKEIAGLGFTILAGDVRSEPIRVAVVDSPSLLVREVRYEFPEYMHRESESVPWQGDLRAVEGTRVMLVTESNQPLAGAWVDLDCDGRRDLKLKIGASDLARATGSFTLAMNADRLEPGERCASTSNRNFEGRQGAGGRSQWVRHHGVQGSD